MGTPTKKYGGLSGVSTSNLDLYEEAQTEKGWITEMPFRSFSFIPESDCIVKINDQTDEIMVKKFSAFSDYETEILKFIIVTPNVEYIFSYSYIDDENLRVWYTHPSSTPYFKRGIIYEIKYVVTIEKYKENYRDYFLPVGYESWEEYDQR